MNSDDLGKKIEYLCKVLGHLCHHCHDSRKCSGAPGLPDYIIVSATGKGILWIELKEWGNLSPEQTIWKWALKANGADFRLYRGHQWDEIEDALVELAS